MGGAIFIQFWARLWRAMGFAAGVVARFARGRVHENGLFIFWVVLSEFLARKTPSERFSSISVTFLGPFWLRARSVTPPGHPTPHPPGSAELHTSELKNGFL